MNRDAGIFRDLRGLGGPHHLRIEALHHSAQMMRVNRSDDGIASFVFAALARDHTDRPAVLGGYARDIDIGDDIAAEILDARDERLRQPAAAPDRHSDAVSFHESHENADAEAGGFLVARTELLPCNVAAV